jgi:hypothetical protein
MDVGQFRDCYRRGKYPRRKVLQQHEYFEGQLAGLRIYANNKAGEQYESTIEA